MLPGICGIIPGLILQDLVPVLSNKDGRKNNLFSLGYGANQGTINTSPW